MQPMKPFVAGDSIKEKMIDGMRKYCCTNPECKRFEKWDSQRYRVTRHIRDFHPEKYYDRAEVPTTSSSMSQAIEEEPSPKRAKSENECEPSPSLDSIFQPSSPL